MKSLRFVFLFALSCLCSSLIATGCTSDSKDKTTAKLHLECEVDVFVDLIKMSDEPLDVFKKNKVNFLVRSNSSNGTSIKISSKNGKLVAKGSPENSINYSIIMNLNDKDINISPSTDATVECPYDASANGLYQFSLQAQIDENWIKNIAAIDDYEDSLTISVSEQ